MLNMLDPEAGVGEPDHAQINCEFRLPVYVVFTSIDATLKALQKAQNIAGILGGRNPGNTGGAFPPAIK